ncbi:hypothetical protein M2408_000072 [Sphingobacterium sp. BIGb0165]|nr:hypothetical protein [Sphingobacterium sp. BIGb0165]
MPWWIYTVHWEEETTPSNKLSRILTLVRSIFEHIQDHNSLIKRANDSLALFYALLVII